MARSLGSAMVEPGRAVGTLMSMHLLWAAGLAALAAIVEWLNGRVLVCRCGRVGLWTGQASGPENSQQLTDWYSLSHLIHGALLYAALRLAMPRVPLGWRLVVAVAVEAGWEILENSPWIIERYRAATIAVGYNGDSILNSMGDIASMAAGFALAARIPTWASIAVAVACELIALAVIRDNLTLNVIMLVHPSASIRAWQAAAG